MTSNQLDKWVKDRFGALYSGCRLRPSMSGGIVETCWFAREYQGNGHLRTLYFALGSGAHLKWFKPEERVCIAQCIEEMAAAYPVPRERPLWLYLIPTDELKTLIHDSHDEELEVRVHLFMEAELAAREEAAEHGSRDSTPD